MVRRRIFPHVSFSRGALLIAFRLAALKESKPHEYLLRFFFGGLCTVAAGLVAKAYGPVVGGLFLAFPAIFPASASLIESHERKRKSEIGADGTQRGRMAAAIDAAGAALGCIGLMIFGWIVAVSLEGHAPVFVIAAASIAWLTSALLLWGIRKRRLFGPPKRKLWRLRSSHRSDC